MLEFEELNQRLMQSEKPIENLKEALDIDNLVKEVAELEKQSSAPDFWDDMQQSQKTMQKIGSLKAKIASYENLKGDFEDAQVMIELADEENDDSLIEDCTKSVDDIEKKIETLTLSTLLNGEFDDNNAILTFHAGAGGTEAQDWAEMLFRMYNRWGERKGYKVSTLDYLEGDVAGIKSATILVEGETLTVIYTAKWVFTDSFVYLRLTRRVAAIHRLHLLRLCRKLMMMLMSKFVKRILRWMFTVPRVQADKR